VSLLRLAHDVLDSQLVDRDNRYCGKVDGIVLEQDADGTLRVAALEVGMVTLLDRVHPRLGAWLRRWGSRLGPAAPHAVRIPWSKVARVSGTEIHVDIHASATPLWTLERWLAERVIARLPGGS
jgi:hypothetical protein